MALAVLNRSTATRRRFLALLACLLLSAIVPPARADVLYSNPPDLGVTQNGLCLYNTACSVNTFVAQPFALTQLSTVTGAGFNSVVRNALFAPDAYWMILANGGGLPGLLLASGTSPLTHAPGPSGSLYDTTDYSFAIPALVLADGFYYLAIQAVTTNAADFLSYGLADGGAAHSNDGGTTWFLGIADGSSPAISAAISLTGTPIPEPATIALLGTALLGTALLGTALLGTALLRLGAARRGTRQMKQAL